MPPRVERERRVARDRDRLAEGDGDRDQGAGGVGAVRLRRGDIRDRRQRRVVDEGAGRSPGVAGGVGRAGGDRVGVAVGQLACEGRCRVRPRADGAAGCVVEDRELVEGGAAPVEPCAILDRDLHRADRAGAARVGRAAGDVGGQARRVVGVAVDGRGRDRGGRVTGVDDDRLLAADRARPADGRQRQRRVVGGRVLDRAARERKRVRCAVVEIGAVLAARGRVGERQRRAAATGAVGRGAARIERQRGRARHGHALAEGDRDRDRACPTGRRHPPSSRRRW